MISQEGHDSTERRSNQSDFDSSRGWVYKFPKHNDFAFRSKTTIGQKEPTDVTEKVTLFTFFCKSQIKSQFSTRKIGIMVETANPAEIPGRTLLSNEKQKLYQVQPRKMRTTICRAACARRRRLKHLFQLKSKRCPQQLNVFPKNRVS